MIRITSTTWICYLILAALVLPAILLLTYGGAWSLESMGDAVGGCILRTAGCVGLVGWSVTCFLLLISVAIRLVADEPS